MAKLTKSYVDKLVPLPPDEDGRVKDSFHWDGVLKGFGVRVNAAGRSWVVQGRIGSGRAAPAVRMTIGPCNVHTPEEARDRARRHLLNMHDGIDPRTKPTDAQTMTLRKVAEQYMRRDLADKTKADYHKMLDGPLSHWADKPLASIDREDVLAKFRVKKADAPAYANIAFQTLRSFFNYAMNRWPDDFPQRNPVKIIARGEWAPKKARTDRIPDDKLSAVWKHLQDARAAAVTRQDQRVITAIDLVTFLLLTGARISEAAGLTWERVNLDAGVWHIPSPKNRNPVYLPLSTQAVELLRKRPTREGYVFATPRGHMNDPRKTMANLSKVAGCELSPHDLRRTFTNTAFRLCRIELWRVEALTNHVSKGVTLQNYGDTQDLKFLKPEVQMIADKITG